MSTTIARVQTVYTGFSGAPGVSTFYFRRRTSGGWEDYVNQAIDRAHNFYDGLATRMSTDGHYTTQAAVDIINDANGELEQTLIGTAQSGTGSGYVSWAPLPTGLCIQWLTDAVRRGRHVRGRTFFVPIAADNIAGNGSPTGDCIDAVEAAADGYIGSGAEAIVPVVWSRPKYTKAVPPVLVDIGTYCGINGRFVKPEFAVLRSRRN